MCRPVDCGPAFEAERRSVRRFIAPNRSAALASSRPPGQHPTDELMELSEGYARASCGLIHGLTRPLSAPSSGSEMRGFILGVALDTFRQEQVSLRPLAAAATAR